MSAILSRSSQANSEGSKRLDRLLSFLHSDPQNETLRADVFEQAFDVGNEEVAEQLIAVGLELGRDPNAWRFREARLRMAQRRFEEAEDLLTRLKQQMEPQPAISHNLAFIAALRGDYQACFEELLPWTSKDPAVEVDPSIQTLWLKSLHHLSKLELALQWAEQRRALGKLTPAAIGVASLIAIDADQTVKAKELADQALAAGDGSLEALLARAAVALAERDTTRAHQYLQQAMQRAPDNGRCWSTLGLAQMLDMDITTARQSLQKAVTLMPGHIGTWHSLGWACLVDKDIDAAQQAFEAAMQLDRNFGESHGALAIIAALRGQRTSAIEQIRRATGLDKNSLSAGYAQAVLNGEIADPQSLQNAMHGLLSSRIAPMGEPLLDLLPPLPQINA
ncbi:hypothetical protein [Collimonas sp.]|jgi:Flp pilus assembly protein TadD|uniref:hypothetical protein n=1 Tax=Collimonas sp. TaxID=1963772 RepID=UPI002CC0040C|nr:hypothetical protein [Collimonas sp.]HWW08335.1 hypothetical protein [Collimonas sp.]